MLPQLRWLLLLLLLGSAATAHADLGISARTSGMGGTANATAQGGEAIFYNPSLLPATQDTEVGLSANAYGYVSTRLTGFYSISGPQGTEATDLESTSILAFPSAASTVYPFDALGVRHAFGLGVFVPFGVEIEGESYFDPVSHPSSRLLTFQERSRQYWLTGAYGVDLGALAIGAAAIVQFSQFELRNGFTATEPGPNALVPTFLTGGETVDGKSVDLRAMLGASLALDRFHLALIARSPTVNAGGMARWRSQEAAAVPSGNEIRAFLLEGAGSSVAQPLELRAGAAFVVPDSLTISADVSVSLPRSSKLLTYEPFEVEGVRYTDDYWLGESALLLNVSAGVELWVSQAIALRAGAFLITGDGELAGDDELAAVNAAIRAGTMSSTELGRLVGMKTQDFGGTLGLSYRRGGARTDVALIGMITSGDHITTSDEMNDAGDRLTIATRNPVEGFAFVVSVGGTYGFDDEEDE